MAEDIVSESQCGFQSSNGTVDIFAVGQIQGKCREQHVDLFKVFIDLTNAFDIVDQRALWEILAKVGCPEKHIRIFLVLHDDMKTLALVDRI